MDIEVKNESLNLLEIEELIKKLQFENLTADLYKDTDFNNQTDKIILIQSDINPKIGHYILIYKNNKGTINYFDPSGTKPLEIWEKYKLNTEYQDPDKLYEFLKTTKKITYNENNYQNTKSVICGIMCLVRYYFKNLTNTAFKTNFRNLKKKFIEINKNIKRADQIDYTFIEIMKTLLK